METGNMKVVWCWIYEQLARGQLRPHGISLSTLKTKSEDELEASVTDADFLVVRRTPVVTERIIKAGKRLKLIQRVGTEYSNIDVRAAKEAGVQVATMRIAADVAVAEHTITLLLVLARRILSCHRSVIDGEYERLGIGPQLTTETTMAPNWTRSPSVTIAYHKTLGLIGLGEIGKEVARRARCLGMGVTYYRRNRLEKIVEKALGVQYADLDDLLRQADFVSLHVPHTSETQNIIGRRELSLMKNTACLINTARGGIVDEDALVEALTKRTIAGAGLDVFREEPLPKKNALLNLDNVVLTPHTASESEFNETQVRWIVDNIIRYAQGQSPRNIVRGGIADDLNCR